MLSSIYLLLGTWFLSFAFVNRVNILKIQFLRSNTIRILPTHTKIFKKQSERQHLWQVMLILVHFYWVSSRGLQFICRLCVPYICDSLGTLKSMYFYLLKGKDIKSAPVFSSLIMPYLYKPRLASKPKARWAIKQFSKGFQMSQKLSSPETPWDSKTFKTLSVLIREPWVCVLRAPRAHGRGVSCFRVYETAIVGQMY